MGGNETYCYHLRRGNRGKGKPCCESRKRFRIAETTQTIQHICSTSSLLFSPLLSAAGQWSIYSIEAYARPSGLPAVQVPLSLRILAHHSTAPREIMVRQDKEFAFSEPHRWFGSRRPFANCNGHETYSQLEFWMHHNFTAVYTAQFVIQNMQVNFQKGKIVLKGAWFS